MTGQDVPTGITSTRGVTWPRPLRPQEPHASPEAHAPPGADSQEPRVETGHETWTIHHHKRNDVLTHGSHR